MTSTSPLDLLRAHGTDAVSFQALESGLTWWQDPAGAVPYAETDGGWVAAGRPLAADGDVADVARRFIDSARAAGRRASFFATEDPSRLPGCEAILLGEQPIFLPSEWEATLAARRRLREQLRRARAKGVRIRAVHPAELAPGEPLRAEVERLTRAWLTSRRMEPMGFLVSVEPFHAPGEHRYLAAQKCGELVAFLSAVPIYARRGWLVEDVLRGPEAPNGTAELLLDALMRDVAADSDLVTLGLAPLSGPVPAWQRAMRWLTRPLYDFRGVRAFKERLRPARWEPVWLVYPKGESAAVHLVDALRAFARGPLWRFGLRTAARHPGVFPWLLALPLAPWTAILAVRAALGMTSLLGWSRPVLGAWAAFDAVLCVALFRIALRPSARALWLAAAAAAVDAALSLRHLAAVGLGETRMQSAFRIIQCAAPIIGVLALGWAAWRMSTRSLTRQ